MGASAPLLSIPEAPAPEGARAQWFEGQDGLRLRAAVFPGPEKARGSVVLSPGRAEPLEKYFEVAGELNARGFHVLAHDWRGQGLSDRLLVDRRKGHAQGLDPFLEDFALLLDRFGSELPDPWILLGHSMGGCLNLLSLARGEPRFAAAALTAPMLGVPTGPVPPALARRLCALMARLGRAGDYLTKEPNLPDEDFEGNFLTHDRRRFSRFKAQLAACPDLALGGVTWGWVAFALDAAAEVARPGAMEGIALPVSLILAGEEKIVLNPPSRAAAARLPHGRCVTVEGARHEILMETDERRAAFWREFDALVDPLTPPRA